MIYDISYFVYISGIRVTVADIKKYNHLRIIIVIVADLNRLQNCL